MASNNQGTRQMSRFSPRVGGAGCYAQIVIKEPNTSEPKKAKRKRITPEQLKELTAVFDKSDTPTHDIREELSKKLGMTNREVQVWFQNRRAKYNRMRIERQRQIRTNTALLINSGLYPVAPPPVQMPAPMPLSALPPQQHPLYGYQNGLAYRSNAGMPPDSGDTAHHVASASATPLTPTAGYQYAHVQSGPEYAGIMRPARTPPLASAPMLYGPLSPPSPDYVRPALSEQSARYFVQGCAMRPPPAARRNTVSAYQGTGVGISGRLSPPALSPPMGAPIHEAGIAAAARSRYLPAVPSRNNQDGNRYAGRYASPPAPGYSCNSASETRARAQLPAAAADAGSPVKLPSIQAMLACADDADDSASGDTCGTHSPLRGRAYTSPSPVLADSASADPCANPGANAPAHNAQPLKPSTANPRAPVWNSGNQHRFGYRCNASSSDTQFRDAKMGIDVLATAAISVSSAKGSDSLPHLTPLSEFSYRASSQQHGSPAGVPSSPIQQPPPQQQQPQQSLLPNSEGGERSGMQSRKITPADNGRSFRTWRPW
ncbi:hypothetical protein IWW50_005430 [Coemansia erecta]|nr:hypothetical protein GGF43_002084 [Coemansia sp. RSA 2618]KAJ2819517.1 hypothetical protein IWW50_005430 [Coemansia erecta]